jgi:hypothetical protein
MADGMGARDWVMDGNPPRTEAQAAAERKVNALRVEDERIALAIKALPQVAALLAVIKPIADRIDKTERRFGSKPIMALAGLADDLWMACESFVADVPDLRAELNREG